MDLEKSVHNGIAEGFCLIKSVEKKLSAKKQPYLDLVLTDAGGEMSAKLWDYSPERHGEYQANMMIKVRGSIDMWNNAPQLRIDRIRPATDADGVEYASFVPCAPYSPEWMYQQVLERTEQLADADIKALVLCALQEKRDALLIWPAAVKMHHAVRGGLLYHTLSILRMGERTVEVYPFLNKDLVFAGIILHDLAKIEELEVSESGIASGYTTRGQLLGHLCGGVVRLQELGNRLGTPVQKLTLLQHMVFSHHGIPEFGSPIPPMFPEAEVVSQLDTLDATLFEMERALEKAEPDGVTGRVWGLDRKLYRHAYFVADGNADLAPDREEQEIGQ